MIKKGANPQDDGTFLKIQKTFSATDIRTVYEFERLIGGGHVGSVRIAHRINNPKAKYAVKSILRENISITSLPIKLPSAVRLMSL